MNNFELIARTFTSSRNYILCSQSDRYALWDNVKKDKALLKWAIELKRNEYDNYCFNNLAICDSILSDYELTDTDEYMKLVNLIYSNVDIACEKYINEEGFGVSFLVSTLMNKKLKLNSKQKEFAYNEAIKKKTIHGYDSPFDIRYWILKNPNYTDDEKRIMVNEFWNDNISFNKTISSWEDGIITMATNNSYTGFSPLIKEIIYDCSMEELFEYYDDEITNELYNEIEFCKQIKEMRNNSFLKKK